MSTFSGRPEILQCIVVSVSLPAATSRPQLKSSATQYGIRESSKATIMDLAFTHRGVETTFEMPVPESELGTSAYRQYEYALRRPSLRVVVLVSSWGEQKKLLAFRFNTEREFHVAPRTSHWCEVCVA